MQSHVPGEYISRVLMESSYAVYQGSCLNYTIHSPHDLFAEGSVREITTDKFVGTLSFNFAVANETVYSPNLMFLLQETRDDLLHQRAFATGY